eukprot:g53586.t1
MYLGALALASLAKAQTIPLFMWSGQSYFESGNAVSENLAVHDVVSAIQKIGSKHTETHCLSSYLKASEQKPEVVVAFVAEELGTAQASKLAGGYSSVYAATGLRDLKAQLDSAASHLQVPYVTLSGPSVSELLRAKVSTKVDKNAQVMSTSLSGKNGLDRIEACNDLISDIQNNAGMFENGVTDLVLVRFRHAEEEVAGECLRKVMTVVRRATSKYLALYSADSAPGVHAPTKLTLDANMLNAAQRRSMLEPATNTNNFTYECEKYGYCGPVYVTGDIMFAILLVLFMIFVFWTGVASLLEVSAPPRFAYQNLSHSLAKEM